MIRGRIGEIKNIEKPKINAPNALKMASTHNL